MVENNGENSSNVVASQLPNGDRLQRRPLVPKCSVTLRGGQKRQFNAVISENFVNVLSLGGILCGVHLF